MPGNEDEELIRRFLRGEHTAFETLMRKYQRRVDRLAYHMVGDAQAAEDITQETFFKAYRSLSSFRRHSAFSAWLYRITINLALNYRRRGGSRFVPLEHMHNQVQPNHSPDPARTAERAQMRVHVRKAVDALPAHYRLVIILRDLQECSYQEIAEILHIPLGTVRSRLHAGKRLLEKKLSRLIGDRETDDAEMQE
jgi:RNA polymerase sigma-70 factor (ECF subfamily)